VSRTHDGHGSVAAVVVTYNRKDFLAALLPTLIAQSRPLDAIYVVDNASTDGTGAFLIEEYQQQPMIHPVFLTTNSGGSGGFYAGVRQAYLDVVEMGTNLDPLDRRGSIHVDQLGEAFDAAGLALAERRWPPPDPGTVGAIAL